MSKNIQESLKFKIIESVWEFLRENSQSELEENVNSGLLEAAIKETITKEFSDLTVIRVTKDLGEPLRYTIEITYPPELEKLIITDFGVVE